MLVLTRKVGERIAISGGIEVVIIAALGGKATIGIEAPEHVAIWRDDCAGRPDANPTDKPL